MTSPIYGAPSLVAMAQAAYDTTTSPKVFTTTGASMLALDLNVVSFQGGTTPTITFFLERQTANGDWSQIWTSGALNAATNWGVDIGPGFGTFSAPSNLAQHAVLTNSARIRWAFGGGANPTTVTFSLSVVGRP